MQYLKRAKMAKKNEKSVGGAICGGSREAAEKLLKEKGHCEKHSKLRKGCDECFKVWLDLYDANFMALM